jgi:hypothetical protein
LSLGFANAHATVPDYVQFELQARSNLLVNDPGWNLPPGSSFNSISASINNSGKVAFPVQIVPINGSQSNTGVGLWVGAHGAGGIVALHEPPVDGISDRVSNNASGQVVYYTYENGSNYRLRQFDAATSTSGVVSTSPFAPSAFNGHEISDGGDIGYRARIGSGYALLRTGNGFTTIYVADNMITPGPYFYLYTPSMNALFEMACKVNVNDFSHTEIRRFRSAQSYDTIAVDHVTDPNSPFSSFDNSLAYNDAGQTAVAVRLQAGNVRAIYRFPANGSNDPPVEIARVDPGGTIRAIESFPPAMNSQGLVVFRAQDANGQAIYAGDGTNLVRIIGKEDAVATDLGPGRIGQHIDDPTSWPIFSGAPTVNDDGDIAFIAALHPDGDTQTEWGSGVFVAYAVGDAIFSDGFESP